MITNNTIHENRGKNKNMNIIREYAQRFKNNRHQL